MIQLFKALPEVRMSFYEDEAFFINPSEQPMGFSIDAHVPGERVEEVLLVAAGEIRTGQTGREWLQFTFNSPAGSCKGKQWINQGTAEEALRPYLETRIVRVEAKVEEYPPQSGNKSLTVQRVTPIRDASPTQFLPQLPAEESLETYRDQLLGLIDQLDAPYREIALSILRQYWEDFSTRPAALFHHHAYIGGLLKHTACMMTIGRGICDSEQPYLTLLKCIQEAEADHKNELFQASEREIRQFSWDDSFDALYQAAKGIALLNQRPNPNELLLGILLHDIGKLWEYTHAGASIDRFSRLLHVTEEEEELAGISLDPDGVLMGHMPYGCFVLEQTLREEDIRLSRAVYHRLMHMVLSHHGKREWGSSVTPQTVDAWYLHAIDLLDARKEKWRQQQGR